MADFAPPSGPPPPKVPEGWKAVWNEQYSEWFFVNVYTKKSQWDKPTEAVYPPGEAPPDAPPPSYAPPADGQRLSSEKSRLGTNNPYANVGATSSQNISDDEKLARQLQEEEEAQARGEHRGAADAFYSQGTGTPQAGQYGYGQQNPYGSQGQGYGGSSADTQDKGKSKGLLGKLLGKAGGHSSKPQQQSGYGGYGQPMQGGYYGGQPGYGQPGYGQPGYYPQQPMYGQPPRRTGGGMGAGGAAALGLGGGLLGGALIGEAMADAGDGGDYGGDGGDFGGDGGDFGGDMGGGDF